MATKLLNPNDWTLSVEKPPTAKRRRGATLAASDDLALAQFLAKGVTVESTHEASTAPARRGGSPVPLELAVTAGASEGRIVAVRHASGAITFHPPIAITQSTRPARRGGAKKRASRGEHELRFSIPPGLAPASERRGLVSRVLKVAVLKVLGKVADVILPKVV